MKLLKKIFSPKSFAHIAGNATTFARADHTHQIASISSAGAWTIGHSSASHTHSLLK